MPRRNRREPSGASDGDDGELSLLSVQERILGPASARLEGFEVRGVVSKLKRYKCPYCGGWVEPGTHHTVAVPVGAADARRHYHTGCWSKHVRGQSSLTRGVRR